jgi:hypothetical protein
VTMMRAGREWFARARIGLFTHYTYATYRTADNFGGTWRSSTDRSGGASVDEVAAAFDADSFAEAAVDMAAQYVVFTACHAGFNLLFPSATMARTGATHKTAKTDAVGRLLEALGAKGVPLVLYMPPNDNHDIGDEDLARMGWLNDDEGRERFVNALLREINARYAGRIAGIWFDQGGPRASAKAAFLEGNPDGVLFVNRGITGDNEKSAISDFLVSEFYGQIPAGDTDALPVHHSQINRIFGGSWWACGGRATADARGLFRYTVRVAATEGQLNAGVNWACGPYLEQSWESGVRELMHSFGELVRRNSRAIYDTVPSTAYVTKSGATLDRDAWGVATESLDRGLVYLHVLNPVRCGVLRLAPAADGTSFDGASMLDGRPARLVPAAHGYDIAIDGDWSDVDTVIVLRRQHRRPD